MGTCMSKVEDINNCCSVSKIVPSAKCIDADTAGIQLKTIRSSTFAILEEASDTDHSAASNGVNDGTGIGSRLSMRHAHLDKRNDTCVRQAQVYVRLEDAGRKRGEREKRGERKREGEKERGEEERGKGEKRRGRPNSDRLVRAIGMKRRKACGCICTCDELPKKVYASCPCMRLCGDKNCTCVACDCYLSGKFSCNCKCGCTVIESSYVPSCECNHIYSACHIGCPFAKQLQYQMKQRKLTYTRRYSAPLPGFNVYRTPYNPIKSVPREMTTNDHVRKCRSAVDITRNFKQILETLYACHVNFDQFVANFHNIVRLRDNDSFCFAISSSIVVRIQRPVLSHSGVNNFFLSFQVHVPNYARMHRNYKNNQSLQSNAEIAEDADGKGEQTKEEEEEEERSKLSKLELQFLQLKKRLDRTGRLLQRHCLHLFGLVCLFDLVVPIKSDPWGEKFTCIFRSFVKPMSKENGDTPGTPTCDRKASIDPFYIQAGALSLDTEDSKEVVKKSHNRGTTCLCVDTDCIKEQMALYLVVSFYIQSLDLLFN